MPHLVIIQDHLRPGGTESHTVWLAGAMRADGVETAILTFRPGGKLLPRAKSDGVSVKSLQGVDTGLDWFAPGLVSSIAAHEPDAVLLMGRMANARAKSLRKALPGVRLVGAVRSGRPIPWYVRGALSSCDAVVSNSRAIAATLAKHGVAPEKTVVIPNPPVLAPLAPDIAVRERVRSAQRASSSDRVLLCVAGFRKGKGQDELIRALARTPEFSRLFLWLAGDGDTRKDCEKLAKELRLTHRVRFLGHVDDPRELYLAADLAVMASGAEGLPNFLVEAQLHGLPVVATDVGGVKETFLPDQSGELVPAGDLAALAAAWMTLAEDTPRRAIYGARARAWAAETFTESAAVAAYRKVFGFNP